MLTVSQIEQSILTISEISAKQNLERFEGGPNKKEEVRQKNKKLISGGWGANVWNWRVCVDLLRKFWINQRKLYAPLLN